jgi:hypothetical protein
VREVPGSIPGWALLHLPQIYLKCKDLCFAVKKIEAQICRNDNN